MKRIKALGIGLAVSLAFAIGLAGAARATWSSNFQSSDTAVLAEGDTHKGSLYVTGNQVTIDGTIAGSLYCAGSTVTINGTVEGDVLCAGQKVTINGVVKQDVRVAGQFVEVGGTIGGSLSAFGQDVRLSGGALVTQDINGAAQQMTLDGVVGRDVAMGAQLLVLNGEVKGNVDVGIEQLQLGSSASVLGNFNYSAQKELSVNDSQITGTINYNPSGKEDKGAGVKQFITGFKMVFFLSLALSAVLLVLVMPRFLNRSSEIFGTQMASTALLGFAVAFGSPILAGLLIFSVLLMPIGLVILFGWLVTILLSGIFFAYWVGSELLRAQQNIVVRMLGGMAVVLVLYMVPFINVLVMFTALVVGSGMIVSTLTKGYRRPSYSVEKLPFKTAPKKSGR